MSSGTSSTHCLQVGTSSACHPQACTSSAHCLQAHMSSTHHLQNSSWSFSACRIWTLFTCYLHMYMSSTHYLSICVLCTHYLQWSLICSFLTDNADVIHTSSLVISNTPFIPYYPQLSFCTLFTHTHIVHVICMLSAYVHIICLSSLTLLIYLIIYNLVSTHCLHTCIL